MASSGNIEEYPHEIDEQLRSFDSSVTAVKSMLDRLMSMSRNELLQKVTVDPDRNVLTASVPSGKRIYLETDQNTRFVIVITEHEFCCFILLDLLP